MTLNMNLEWRKVEKDGENKREHYLNIPVKIINAVDDGYGYHGTLICNECNSKVDQFYICSACGDKNKIGNITKRKDEKAKVIYEETQKQAFLENTIDKTIKVVDEIDNIYETLGFRAINRNEKSYEIYNNDQSVSPVIAKIYNYLVKHKTGLIVTFGYTNKGKGNKLGGILIAGDGQLNLMQLRDYRLIRQPKQEGLSITVTADENTKKMDIVSENQYPELYEKFLEMVKQGQKIEVKAKPKEKEIVVECGFLDG